MKSILLRILSQRRTTIILGIALAIVVLATLATLILWAVGRRAAGPPGGGIATSTSIADAGDRLAYSELQGDSTILWLAYAREPSRRERVAQINHRLGYGIKASLSPDGKRLAYVVLSPQGADPSSQASLRVVSLEEKREQLLIEGLDLRSAPVWSRDGKMVSVRRTSPGGGQQLLAVDVAQGREQRLVADDSAFGLYPFAWSKDDSLLYARIDPKGTDLMAVAPSGKVDIVAHLADGIARGFSLSPQGDKVLYSVPGSDAKKTLGSVETIALDANKREVLLADPTSSYHPIWSPDGKGVTYNTDPSNPATRGGLANTANESLLPPPENGFDVPLAWAPSGQYLAVRSILGPAQSPTSEELAIISATDASHRRLIASGYAEFIGWLGGATSS